MGLSLYTTFQVGLPNVWISSFGIIVTQFTHMLSSFKVENVPYILSSAPQKTKINSYGSSAMQIIVLIIPIFMPLKISTFWFIVGAIIFIP